MKWQSSQYSESDMSRMQREAIQRTKEMQRRAKEAAAQFNRDFSSQNPPAFKSNMPRHSHNLNNNSRPPEVSHGSGEEKPAAPMPIKKIVDALGLDHEKIVLIGLMLILLNDGGINNTKNQKLLMALAYLLFF